MFRSFQKPVWGLRDVWCTHGEGMGWNGIGWHVQSMFINDDQCWTKLISVGRCWSMLVNVDGVDQCSSVLTKVGQCWSMLIIKVQTWFKNCGFEAKLNFLYWVRLLNENMTASRFRSFQKPVRGLRDLWCTHRRGDGMEWDRMACSINVHQWWSLLINVGQCWTMLTNVGQCWRC